jgi:hypothetical protein
MIKEVENSIIPKLLKVGAITLYPFILYSGKITSEIQYHEKVHVEQIKRLGCFRFYWEYLVEYIKLRFQGYTHNQAYYNITFETEAIVRTCSAKINGEIK